MPLYIAFSLGMFYVIYSDNKKKHLKRSIITNYYTEYDMPLERFEVNAKLAVIGLFCGMVTGVVGAGGIVGASLFF